MIFCAATVATIPSTGFTTTATVPPLSAMHGLAPTPDKWHDPDDRRHSVNERIGREVSAKWVKDRLAEAQAARLIVCGDGSGSVRLTALGVGRLSSVSPKLASSRQTGKSVAERITTSIHAGAFAFTLAKPQIFATDKLLWISQSVASGRLP
jgi:hypothetical protein